MVELQLKALVEPSDACLNASIHNYWLINAAGWGGRQTDVFYFYETCLFASLPADMLRLKNSDVFYGTDGNLQPKSTFDPIFKDQKLFMRGLKFPTKYDPKKRIKN